MENISLLFGQRIKNLRNAKKLSQEKLAELSGLHSTYIGQIERAEKNPTLESIYKLSAGLGISLSELLKNIEENTDTENTANKIYNSVISLPLKKQKNLYKIIEDIIRF